MTNIQPDFGHFRRSYPYVIRVLGGLKNMQRIHCFLGQPLTSWCTTGTKDGKKFKINKNDFTSIQTNT